MRSFRVSFVLLMAGTSLLWQCKSKSPEQIAINPLSMKADTVITPVIKDMPLASAVDSICVVKHQRRMYVYNTGQLLKVYQISLGTTPVGAKHFQGDRKTPEGLYYINGKNPNSMAHKNLGISYPNEHDRQYAIRQGLKKSELKAAREQFFIKGQPCLRTSPLAKRYGWGIHHDAECKVAIYPMESKEYQKFAKDKKLEHTKAMRTSRK